MEIVKLLKEHFPEVQHRDRKKFIPMIKYKSEKEGVTFLEVIKAERLKHLEQKEKEMHLFMRKMFSTAFLIESNDELAGTSLSGYYCEITKQSGRSFMNAQNRLYQKEFNDIATVKTKSTNDILKLIERYCCILGNAVMNGKEDVCKAMELMQSDEVFEKRVMGIYKKHKTSM